MASKKGWNGKTKKTARGRPKGSKNLKRVEGGLKNQHGVIFSEAERKEFNRAVDRANYRRKKMLEQEAQLPRMVAGREIAPDQSQLQLMGKESDFILARRGKSLQRFKSREDFERYMTNLERVSKPDYIEDRVRLYKRNHMQALDNVFGDDAKDIKMKIRMMKPADYMKLVQQDETLEVSYIYDPSARAGKLNQMRASLGMKLKEQPIE